MMVQWRFIELRSIDLPTSSTQRAADTGSWNPLCTHSTIIITVPLQLPMLLISPALECTQGMNPS